MVKTLKKFGNTQALVIDKSMREQLGIDEATPLEVTISGGRLIVTPANVGVGSDAVDRAVRELREAYTPMLKKLAE